MTEDFVVPRKVQLQYKYVSFRRYIKIWDVLEIKIDLYCSRIWCPIKLFKKMFNFIFEYFVIFIFLLNVILYHTTSLVIITAMKFNFSHETASMRKRNVCN